MAQVCRAGVRHGQTVSLWRLRPWPSAGRFWPWPDSPATFERAAVPLLLQWFAAVDVCSAVAVHSRHCWFALNRPHFYSSRSGCLIDFSFPLVAVVCNYMIWSDLYYFRSLSPIFSSLATKILYMGSFSKVPKSSDKFLMEIHLRSTGCHLPYVITQYFTCHPTWEHTPP